VITRGIAPLTTLQNRQAKESEKVERAGFRIDGHGGTGEECRFGPAQAVPATDRPGPNGWRLGSRVHARARVPPLTRVAGQVPRGAFNAPAPPRAAGERDGTILSPFGSLWEDYQEGMVKPLSRYSLAGYLQANRQGRVPYPTLLDDSETREEYEKLSVPLSKTAFE